jgi:uncharacterized protein (UPF0210 family)
MLSKVRVGSARLALWLLIAAAAPPLSAQDYTRPKVRAVTAFVRLQRPAYQPQIADALTVLRSAKSALEQQGYEVQTLRIVTQPLGELVAGQSDEAALAFLKALSELGTREGFIPNVGPAMLRDADDAHVMRLLERALAQQPNLMGNAIIAGEDGIHWRVINESAALIRYLADHTAHGQGNFRFTATAMLEPYGPFYPGAYHTGPGRRFSLGLQAGNVVQEVFARTHGDFDHAVAELTRQLTVHAQAAERIGEQVGGEGGAGEAGRFRGAHGSGVGRQGARTTLGGRHLQHRRAARLFVRLCDRARYRALSGQHHRGAAGAHSR